MIKQFLLLFLFSSLSFTQDEDIVNILNIPLGLSIETVQEKWDCNNFNKYANLIHKTDDALKYEGKKDSFFLNAIFYFVEDSLYSFVCIIKQPSNDIKQLSNLVSNKLGKPDSINIQKFGSEAKGNVKEYKISFWAKKNLINNSIDNITVSEDQFIDALNLFSFNNYNSLLSSKARLLKKHQIKL